MQAALVGRVIAEKRRVIVLLLAAGAINAALYLGAVVPLGVRVASADRQAQGAEAARRIAEQEYRQALAAAEGKQLAQEELARFYTDVLPADLAGARATYARLRQLAEQTQVRFKSGRTDEPVGPGKSALSKLQINTVLEGEYPNVRRLLHALEVGPEFIVIENVELAQGTEPGGPLVLTLDAATYYRKSSGGSHP